MKTGGTLYFASVRFLVLNYSRSVARLVSDVLTRNRDDPNFEIAVLPCSVTYMYVVFLAFASNIEKPFLIQAPRTLPF